MNAQEVDALPTTTAEQDRQTAGERKIAEVAPPTTTRFEDQKAEGQRSISIIWERTQQIIALSWVLVGLGVAGFEVIRQGPRADGAMTMIVGTLGVIIGFYFSRTNHQRVGGVGGESAGTRGTR